MALCGSSRPVDGGCVLKDNSGSLLGTLNLRQRSKRIGGKPAPGVKTHTLLGGWR